LSLLSSPPLSFLSTVDAITALALSFEDQHFRAHNGRARFLAVHLRLTDFCDTFHCTLNRVNETVLAALRALEARPTCSVGSGPKAFVDLFVMTDDPLHTSLNFLSQHYRVHLYTHNTSVPLISGVRSLDQTLIETEIAANATCFLAVQGSSLSDEVSTRRSVSKNKPWTTVSYYGFEAANKTRKTKHGSKHSMRNKSDERRKRWRTRAPKTRPPAQTPTARPSTFPNN